MRARYTLPEVREMICFPLADKQPVLLIIRHCVMFYCLCFFTRENFYYSNVLIPSALVPTPPRGVPALICWRGGLPPAS
jgi:hypothetical protein